MSPCSGWLRTTGSIAEVQLVELEKRREALHLRVRARFWTWPAVTLAAARTAVGNALTDPEAWLSLVPAALAAFTTLDLDRRVAAYDTRAKTVTYAEPPPDSQSDAEIDLVTGSSLIDSSGPGPKQGLASLADRPTAITVVVAPAAHLSTAGSSGVPDHLGARFSQPFSVTATVSSCLMPSSPWVSRAPSQARRRMRRGLRRPRS